MTGDLHSLSDLVGQEAPVGVLRAALREGRVGHAYLFVGPEGVGKLTAALLFAQALNCEARAGDADACGECKSCRRFAHGNHPQIWRIAPMYRKQPITDPRLLELVEDQAWITIAQTRGDPRDRPPHPPVLHEAALKPVFSPYKVFIFEPADRMTEEAADSLLATLEDPPAGTVFILVSSRPAAMRETVVSRCEQVRFHMVAPQRIEELLHGRGVDPDQARLLAGLADGRPGRAIAMAQRPYLLELRAQAIALAEELFSAPVQAALALASRTLQVAASLWELEYAAIVEQDRAQDDDPADADAAGETKKLGISHTRAMRRAVPQVLEVMAGWLRDIMVAKSGRPELMINRDYRDQAQARAREAGYDVLRQAIDAITRTAAYIRSYVNLDPALEAMYVELAGILAPAQTPRPASRARS
ncbi:MAG TPA: DNA polymerase III subunit [Armatimonadota bacterium]|nr:DNA polymerase III subunit [Armatimonadota bacterium]